MNERCEECGYPVSRGKCNYCERFPLQRPDFGTPWQLCKVGDGWDGIADRDGHVLFKVALNDLKYAEHMVKVVNEEAEARGRGPS